MYTLFVCFRTIYTNEWSGLGKFQGSSRLSAVVVVGWKLFLPPDTTIVFTVYNTGGKQIGEYEAGISCFLPTIEHPQNNKE